MHRSFRKEYCVFEEPCHEGRAAQIYETDIAKAEAAFNRFAWVVAVVDVEGQDGVLVFGGIVRDIHSSYHAIDNVGVVPFYPGHIVYPSLGIASLGGEFGAYRRHRLAIRLVGGPVCSLAISRLTISLGGQKLHIKPELTQ